MSYSEVKALMEGAGTHSDRVIVVADPENGATGITNDSTASSKSYWERDNGVISAIVALYETVLGLDTSSSVDIVGQLFINSGGAQFAGGLEVAGMTQVDGDFHANGNSYVGYLSGTTLEATTHTLTGGRLIREYSLLIDESVSGYKDVIQSNDDYQLVFDRGHFGLASYSDTTGRQGSFLFRGADDKLSMMLSRFGELLVGDIDESAIGGSHGYGISGDIAICRDEAISSSSQIIAVNTDTGSLADEFLVGIHSNASYGPRIIFRTNTTGNKSCEIGMSTGAAIETETNDGGATWSTTINDILNAENIYMDDTSNPNAYIELDVSAHDGYPTLTIASAVGEFKIRTADTGVFVSPHAQIVSGTGLSVVASESAAFSSLYADGNGKRVGFLLDIDVFPDTGVTIGAADGTNGAGVLRLVGTNTSKGTIEVEDDTDGTFYMFSKNGVLKSTETAIGANGGTTLGGHRHQVVDVTAGNASDSATAKTEVAAAAEAYNGNTVYAIDSLDGVTIWVYSTSAADWIKASLATVVGA